MFKKTRNYTNVEINLHYVYLTTILQNYFLVKCNMTPIQWTSDKLWKKKCFSAMSARPSNNCIDNGFFFFFLQI